MKIASFNVENFFERAKAMNLDSWADGRDILNDYAKFNGLIGSPCIRPPTRRRCSTF